MRKQVIERYERTEESNIVERIDKRIEEGYRVISMKQVSENLTGR
jgi:hypothetical protein|nr:MAG TPA: hypothetical protein [Caudoviricetes sp.]